MRYAIYLTVSLVLVLFTPAIIDVLTDDGFGSRLSPVSASCAVAGGAIGSLLFYFSPILLAISNRHRMTAQIAILTIFLGWTVVGWVGALIWATIKTGENPSR